MTGSLYQLVSTGAQDIYIIGKPQITMFKTVFRRHQNFSIYDIIKIPKAKNTFGIDFQVELERSGDLLHKVYLMVELPELTLKNPMPTCDRVKKLLLEYGIIWDTTEILSYNQKIDNCPEIVTLEYYNNNLIFVINDWIRRYVDKYNFYSNANIFSSNPSYLKSSSMEVINRSLKGVFDYSLLYNDGSNDLEIWGDYIKQLYLNINKNLLTDGVVGSLLTLTRLLTRYSQEYLSVYSSKYLPSFSFDKYAVAEDSYGNTKREILMYTDGFRNGYDNINNSNFNILFNTGALLQFLLNYYYDTAFVNTNPITSQYSRSYLRLSKYEYFISNSLFGELLNRPPNTLKNEQVKFQLYDLIDFKNIYYTSLLFNLTRLKIENFPGPYPFQSDRGFTYIGNVKPPLKNPEILGTYNPYISLIDENIIYYHALNPATTLYNINQANVGINLSVYFSNIVQNFYNTYIEGYKEIFPFVNSVKFTTLDSYLITQKYFKQLFETQNNSTVTVDTNQVNEIAELILKYIEYNILYNLAMFRNMINVINNARFFNDQHYRFTFYKNYTKTPTSFNPVSTSVVNSTFKNNYQNPNITYNNNIGDNFEDPIINNLTYFGPLDDENSPSNIPTTTVGGDPITNFFSNSISDEIRTFRTNCSNVLLSFEKLKYMQDYNLWKRGVFDLGNQIQSTYLSYSTTNDPQFQVVNSFSEQYKKIAVMNYIPFLAGRDIPALIYYIFSTSVAVKGFFNIIGDYNSFLSAIDYRDDGDDGAPLLSNEKKTIKSQIYSVMIDSVIGCNQNLIDEDHYNDIVNKNASGANDYLLVNTHRPESLLPEYTEITNLNDFLNSKNNECEFTPNGDLTYLPIEWLSQTYFKLYEKTINNWFIDNNKTNKENVDINTINNILKNILTNNNNIYQFSPSDATNGKINIKDILIYILKCTINCFIGITDPNNNFPTYTGTPVADGYNNYYNNTNSTLTYKENGYTMIALTTETGKDKKILFYRSTSDIFTSPRFSDATSTIWYQLQKKYIFYYNYMFNNTLISKSYYDSSVGALMSNIFDYFKNVINGDRFTVYNYNGSKISSETPLLLGSVDTMNNPPESITIAIYASTFVNVNCNDDFEERVMIKFKIKNGEDNIAVLKNHILDIDLTKTINYLETVQVPENTTGFEISYINNPGYQIYMTILIFLNDSNLYYETSINTYQDKILTTWEVANISTEPIPPIDINLQNGFDFYRMRNLNQINPYTGKQKYNDLTDYINDNITLFNNDLKYYNDYSSILNFVNDDTFVYNDGTSTKNRINANYYYEQSYKIIDLLNEHIDIKYVNPLPLTDNYNEITTEEKFDESDNTGYHQISDIIPPIINEISPLSNSDVIGFAFTLQPNIQSDYGFGFSVGKYPNSHGLIQITKLGNKYYLTIDDNDTIDNILLNIIPSSNTVYYIVQYNNLEKLELYENDNLITTITTSTPQYLNLLPQIKKNVFLEILYATTIKIYDLYNAYSLAGTNVKNIMENIITKWFYIGIDNTNKGSDLFTTFIPSLQNIKSILHSVYQENDESVLQNKYQNTTTTLTQEFHPYGQSIFSPITLSNTDVLGFSFTNLNNNATGLQIGIYGQDISGNDLSIYIDKDTNKLFYKKNNTINSQNLTNFSFTDENTYYFFYYNDISESTRLKIYCLENGTGNVNLYSFLNTTIDFSSFKNINMIVNGEVYVRLFMDRYAYNATTNNDILSIMKNNIKWFYAGGTYSIQYNSNLKNITNIQFISKISNYVKGNNNVAEDINIGQNNFNDIVFPGGNNLLSFPIIVNSQTNNNDIIGFAFSIIDNTSDIIGIGLGNDGYFSNNYLAMIRNYNDTEGNLHSVKISYNGQTESFRYSSNPNDSTKIIHNPIFDKNNIYYCIQNNINESFTIYEDKNECPLIKIESLSGTSTDAYQSSLYDKFVDIFKNNINLTILGKTTIRMYTAKYAYTQTSNTVQQELKKITKWLYIGAEDITPFDTLDDSSLINISYILHTGYLESNIIEKLNKKIYYNSQLEKLNQTFNPTYFKNVYNLNGFDGTVSELSGNTCNIKYNTALYGILDSIYNNRLTGNIDTTFKTLNLDLPIGKIYSDPISNKYNPFYSFSLYDSFINLSSKVNYDGYMIKEYKEYPQAENLLTFGDLKYMSEIFDKVIHEENVTNHALENLLYINQSSFTYQTLELINLSSATNVILQTQSSFEHIFSSKTNIIDGNFINDDIYGFSFTVTNISDTENTTEIGIVINNDINKKIVIRNTDISYDLYLQYDNYKQNFFFGATSPISFSNSNTIYFFVNTTTKSIQIWQNSLEVLNVQIIEPYSVCSLLDLFNKDNVSLFVKGNITINYYSFTEANNTASSDVKTSTNFPATTGWLYPNQNQTINSIIYPSYTYYASGNSDNPNTQSEDFYNTVTINKNNIDNQITDYIFLNVLNNDSQENFKNMNNKDIFGFAFEFNVYNNIDNEFIGIPNSISIGFGSGNIPETNRLQIKKNGSIYSLIINDFEMSLSNVNFNEGNIYLLIQNNINKSLSIYKYNSSNITLILELNMSNTVYENFITSVFNNNANILVSTKEETRIKFYTAKGIFNISSIENKLLIGNLTKWLYIGSQDSSPVKKIVIDPKTLTHHQLINGLSLGANSTTNSIQPSQIILNDKNSCDIILDSWENIAKSVGISVFNTFNNLADFNNYINNINKYIYSFGFSIIDDYSDFSIGFSAWFNTHIVIFKSNNSVQIKIKYIDNNNNNFEETINIPGFKFNKNKIYFVFQNNNDNTFTLYEEEKLITKITTSNISYNNLLFTTSSPFYKSLKSIASLCVSGMNNTAIRFYSKNYLYYIAPISIRNIITLDSVIWFGVSTSESQNIINTSDYRILSVNNSSMYMEPAISMDIDGVLGFSFSILNKDLQDYNSLGIKIGFSNDNIIANGVNSDSDKPEFTFFEISITQNKISILMNGNEYFLPIVPTFKSNDIYYIFQNNIDDNLSIYQNDTMIYKVDTTNTDYTKILNNFNNPIYPYFSGKADFKIHNAPYAYTNASEELQILIDLCTDWISFGGSNIGPIKKNIITSNTIFYDKNVPSLFKDPLKGNLSNMSLVALYMYFQIIQKSDLNKYIDLKPFINYVSEININNTDNGYTQTINLLNNYFKEQIKSNFESITKITNINFEEHKLFINGFNTFIDNTYKQYPLNFNINSNTPYIQRSPNYNFDIELYNQSLTGRPNGIISSDLESRLLKLIVNAPPSYSWVKELGHKIIKEVSVSIGDQIIETHTSDLLHLIHKLKVTPEQERGYNNLIGNDYEMYQYAPIEGKFKNSYGNGNPHWINYYPSIDKPTKKLYIPLYFWFCNNEGNALPMISLVHSRVLLDFKIEKLENLIYLEKDSTIYNTPEVKYYILSQYAYLEEEDRLRMARSKLEYLIEKYNFNGPDIITKDKYFNNPLKRYTNEIKKNITNDQNTNFNQQIFLGLQNIIYHKHELVTNNSTIEKQRSGELNFIEVITRTFTDHEFMPQFNLPSSKIIGFGFEMISNPETDIISYNPPNTKYSNNLNTSTFGIGYKVELYETTKNTKTVKSTKIIELQKDKIVIKIKNSTFDEDYILNNSGKRIKLKNDITIDYIVKPQFRGGGFTQEKDLYLFYHNDFDNKLSIYENSILIGSVNLENGFLPNNLYKRNFSLYLNGQVRIFYYNAKEIYNSYTKELRNIMNTITDWLFVGAGDISPITEIFNYQETPIQTPQNATITKISEGKTQITLSSGNKIKFSPNIKTENNSLIGFAFSINYDTIVKKYDFMIGLSTDDSDDNIIAIQKINNNYVIYINDGVNSVSVPFLKNPICPIQDTKLNIQNQNFRPEIIFVCIQDNISKTFTIFEDNNIIGQINTNSQHTNNNYGNIYSNLLEKLKNNVKFYLHNISSSNKFYVNYYTSNEILANHARLILRRTINNVTQWISLDDFNPSFYVPSFRNIDTLISNNISGGGIIGEQTQISTEVITQKNNFQYLLRPPTFTDVTQMLGFSFSVMEPVASDFEFGISAVNNVFKRIVIKKSGNNFILQTRNIGNVPSNFESKYFPASLSQTLAINEIIYNNKKNSNIQENPQIKIDENTLKNIQQNINSTLENIKSISQKTYLQLKEKLYEFLILNQKLEKINETLNFNKKNNTIDENAIKQNEIIKEEIESIKRSSLYLTNIDLFNLTLQTEIIKKRINNLKLMALEQTFVPSCDTNTNKNLICTNIKDYPLSQNISYGNGSIYTIVQDNTLGIFSIFHNDNIIGQLTLSDKSYADIVSEFRNGFNVFINGQMNLLFYSPQYMYQSSSELVKAYMDRMDKWIFVRKNLDKIPEKLLPYEPTTIPIRINMNDPIKYFIWYMKAFNEKTQKPMDIIDWNRYGFNVRDENGNWIRIKTGDFIEGMKLRIYGVNRENFKPEAYYNQVVPWGRNVHAQSLGTGEYMYSFALYPMMLQPSGAANYSEMDDTWLDINLTNEVESIIRTNEDIKIKLELWGQSINHLRIISGLGAMLFYKEK